MADSHEVVLTDEQVTQQLQSVLDEFRSHVRGRLNAIGQAEMEKNPELAKHPEGFATVQRRLKPRMEVKGADPVDSLQLSILEASKDLGIAAVAPTPPAEPSEAAPAEPLESEQPPQQQAGKEEPEVSDIDRDIARRKTIHTRKIVETADMTEEEKKSLAVTPEQVAAENQPDENPELDAHVAERNQQRRDKSYIRGSDKRGNATVQPHGADKPQYPGGETVPEEQLK